MVPHLSDEWKGTELWKFDLAQNLAVVWDCFAWMVAMSVHKRIGDWAQHREEDGIDFAVEVRHELVLQTALGICHCASQSAMKYSSTKNLERRKSMEFSS